MTEHLLSPELANIELEHFMREALLGAEAAGQAGELAIRAVLVIEGKIVSRGRACHQQMKSQISPAELNGGERLWADYEKAILLTPSGHAQCASARSSWLVFRTLSLRNTIRLYNPG